MASRAVEELLWNPQPLPSTSRIHRVLQLQLLYGIVSSVQCTINVAQGCIIGTDRTLQCTLQPHKSKEAAELMLLLCYTGSVLIAYRSLKLYFRIMLVWTLILCFRMVFVRGLLLVAPSALSSAWKSSNGGWDRYARILGLFIHTAGAVLNVISLGYAFYLVKTLGRGVVRGAPFKFNRRRNFRARDDRGIPKTSASLYRTKLE